MNLGEFNPLRPVLDAVTTVIERAVPDKNEAARIAGELSKAERSGELEAARIGLAAILAEAGSADPWTSRARPTFLYVIYLVILSCMAGAIAGIWWPGHVSTAAQNFSNLLGAVPESLWWLFGAGYLGYTGARSFDKWRGAPR